MSQTKKPAEAVFPVALMTGRNKALIAGGAFFAGKQLLAQQME